LITLLKRDLKGGNCDESIGQPLKLKDKG